MNGNSFIVGMGFVFLIGIMGDINDTSGHLTKRFGDINIEAGWLLEPPLVSDLNSIIVKVTNGTSKDEPPVLNAIANVSIHAKYGTITKQLDFKPSPTTAGEYQGEIIPSRVGPYSLLIQGNIKNQKIDSEFKIEDVESKNSLSFPDSSVSTAGSNNLSDDVVNSISKLANEIQTVKHDANLSNAQINQTKASLENIRITTELTYMAIMVVLGLVLSAVVMELYIFKKRRFDNRIPPGKL